MTNLEFACIAQLVLPGTLSHKVRRRDSKRGTVTSKSIHKNTINPMETITENIHVPDRRNIIQIYQLRRKTV